MSAVDLPAAVPVDRVRQWWNNGVVAIKTLILLLAIIGAVHVTEPMRASAAPASTVEPAAGPAKVAPGK